MDQSSDVLFGLDGFTVLAARETNDGVLVVEVETIDGQLACPECGTAAGGSKGRAWVRLVDVCSAGRRVIVWWWKRRRFCPDPDCDRRSFTEQHPGVGERRRTTRRCRVHVAHQVGVEGRPVVRVAAEVGVSWPTGMAAVHETAATVGITHGVPGEVRALGVDETSFRRGRRFVTNIADLDRSIELDVLEGRSGLLFADWLKHQPAGWLAGIEFVSMDGTAPFRTAVHKHCPNATVVLDRFHALAWFHHAIDLVRRRVSWDVHHRRGRKVDAVWRGRWLLQRAHERLTPNQRDRLFAMLDSPEDPEGEIGYVYLVKETARQVWANPTIGGWGELLQLIADSQIPEIEAIGGTLERWHTEIIASFEHPDISNAVTEGLNRKVKHVKRTGCGFRNQHNYRTRVLYHCHQLP